VSVPQNLAAFDGRVEDFEWTPIEEMPTPTKTEFYCRDENGVLVEAGEFFKRKYDALLATPGWLEELTKKNMEAKEARQRAREERIAERKRRERKA
jgi:hypothetical protein